MKMLLCAAGASAVLLSCATSGGTASTRRVTEGVGETATAELADQRGERVGEVELRQTPNGLLAQVRLSGVPPGEHGFHIHEVGRCEPPFKTAGGHYAPGDDEHGIENPRGKHAGDLPNLSVPADGTLEVTLFLEELSLRQENALLDADGSAFVVHANADDYRTDPAGDAGDRIACGVVQGR